MSQPALSGVDIVKQRMQELPRAQIKEELDPTLRRYLFNPFNDAVLDPLLARHSGFLIVPAGVLFAVESQRYRDNNYAAVGLSELLDASESVNQPSEKTFIRQPGVIASSLVRLFGGENQQATGFCEIEALTGVSDFDLIVDMQNFFFPKRFATVDEAIEHLENISDDVSQMLEPTFKRGEEDAPMWPAVFEKLVWSYQMSRAWCDEKLEATKASIEERANGGFGKRQPSTFDKQICAWLGVKPPRALTKLDLGGESKNVATPQQVVVAAAPSDGLERKQCKVCGEPVALIDGELPMLCRFCHKNPRGSEPKPAAVNSETKTKKNKPESE